MVLTTRGLVAKLAAEFIGTYMLVFTIGCNVIGKSGLFGITSIACCLMVFVYALGPVSGGHFNPAVSTALFISNKLELEDYMMYVLTQLVAGIVGGFSFVVIYGKSAPLEPSAGFTGYQAALVECLYTFMLCFVVLNCCATKKNSGNQYFGLAIGFVIVAGGYGGGSISGGAFNPAVALGLDVTSASEYNFGWCMVYWVAEFLGGALASGIHRAVHPEEYGGSDKPGALQKGLSEFLGTFFLCFTVGLCVLGNRDNGAAWAIGSCLMCMIYCLGSVSGAHFNPAVTIAIALSGRKKISTKDVLLYIIAQFAGGAVGGLAYAEIYGFQKAALAKLTLGEKTGYHYSQALLGEAFFTFILCFTVLATATMPVYDEGFIEACDKEYVSDKKAGTIETWEIDSGAKSPDQQKLIQKGKDFLEKSREEDRAGVLAKWRFRAQDLFGLCIGGAVIAGATAVGGISGGCLNPAVALAVELASKVSGGPTSFHFTLPLYIAKQLEGAILAAIAVRTTHIYEWVDPIMDEKVEELPAGQAQSAPAEIDAD